MPWVLDREPLGQSVGYEVSEADRVLPRSRGCILYQLAAQVLSSTTLQRDTQVRCIACKASDTLSVQSREDSDLTFAFLGQGMGNLSPSDVHYTG